MPGCSHNTVAKADLRFKDITKANDAYTFTATSSGLDITAQLFFPLKLGAGADTAVQALAFDKILNGETVAVDKSGAAFTTADNKVYKRVMTADIQDTADLSMAADLTKSFGGTTTQTLKVGA